MPDLIRSEPNDAWPSVAARYKIDPPFYQHELTSIPAWMSNYTHQEVWNEIIYLFPNFDGAFAEVWKWVSNFFPHFTAHVITCPYWAQGLVTWVPTHIMRPLSQGSDSRRETGCMRTTVFILPLWPTNTNTGSLTLDIQYIGRNQISWKTRITVEKINQWGNPSGSPWRGYYSVTQGSLG